MLRPKNRDFLGIEGGKKKKKMKFNIEYPL